MRSKFFLFCATMIAGVLLASPGSLVWAQQCGDLDNSGSIVTTDALLLLKSAVGQPVTLVCPSGDLVQTGQTTAFGPGSDGDVQAGAALSYTDNGDGTITDNNTGLMWEKKDDSAGIHDQDNTYTWSTGTQDMDGTITTVFLAALNGGGGFAGHTDWRIPNYKELVSILDLNVVSLGSRDIAPAFHTNLACDQCTDVTLPTCSCTGASFYASSTTWSGNETMVWGVNFFDGVNLGQKQDSLVRAVRGSDAVASCGNGIVEAPESCDGVDLGGRTCQGLGFLGGTLACSGDCLFDTSGCASAGGQGDACTSGTDCEQGLLCVDGVCCTSACTGTCESCALPGSQGTCNAVATGQDPDAECAGFACTGFYWGFSGDTCHQREDISAAAAACSGTGICQTAAELCPLQGPGPATLTCDATCQNPAAGSCTGATAGACDDINPGSATCGQGICRMTAPVCINGIPNACTPGNPQAEVCNNLDDDCDGVVDDGLAGDALEPDNSCSSIRTLATVGSSGQTINRTDLTIYPSGDNDYFEIPAVETDSTCECCEFFCLDEDYQLKITLTVPPGAGSYRFCTGTSCSGVDANCQTVAAGQSATLTWTLDGACAVNDSYSRFVRISGLGPPGFECLPYTLSYSFTPGCF